MSWPPTERHLSALRWIMSEPLEVPGSDAAVESTSDGLSFFRQPGWLLLDQKQNLLLYDGTCFVALLSDLPASLPLSQMDLRLCRGQHVISR